MPRDEVALSQLAAYLRRLPKSAWPCGRVVAAQENGVIGGPGDASAIKETCSKVNKILLRLGVKVVWWPSA